MEITSVKGCVGTNGDSQVIFKLVAIIVFSYLFLFLFLNYETFQNNVRCSYADRLVLTDINILHSYICLFSKIFFT